MMPHSKPSLSLCRQTADLFLEDEVLAKFLQSVEQGFTIEIRHNRSLVHGAVR
jgi:hypothetical protein